MRNRTRLAMAVSIAAFLLTLMATTANALRSLSVVGSTTLSLNGDLTFEGGGGIEVICQATIVKTISRVIPKVRGILVGRVTELRFGRAEEARCRPTVGRLEAIVALETASATLWRIFLNSILGTLPNIVGILFEVDNLQVEFIDSGAACLYEGDIGVLARIEPRGAVERLSVLQPNNFRLIRGAFCGAGGQLKANLTPLQTTRVLLL